MEESVAAVVLAAFGCCHYIVASQTGVDTVLEVIRASCFVAADLCAFAAVHVEMLIVVVAVAAHVRTVIVFEAVHEVTFECFLTLPALVVFRLTAAALDVVVLMA